MLTDQKHPITPPPELVREWNEAAIGTHFPPYGYSEYIATQAARWGADQELNACFEWLDRRLFDRDDIRSLRAARRPQSPSLKERALQAWAAVEAGTDDQTAMAVIRRALNQLPNE